MIQTCGAFTLIIDKTRMGYTAKAKFKNHVIGFGGFYKTKELALDCAGEMTQRNTFKIYMNAKGLAQLKRFLKNNLNPTFELETCLAAYEVEAVSNFVETGCGCVEIPSNDTIDKTPAIDSFFGDCFSLKIID